MDKYLQHYAEPEIGGLNGLPDTCQWSHVLVVPACKETAGFLRPPPLCKGRSLLILVINQSAAATADVKAVNLALAAEVVSRFDLRWPHQSNSNGTSEEPGLSLFSDRSCERDILLVDRFSDGRELPEKGGVRLARKIGADLAALLIHQQRVESPWIHCSDGDGLAWNGKLAGQLKRWEITCRGSFLHLAPKKDEHYVFGQRRCVEVGRTVLEIIIEL